ncbi:uncharacterized protein LOC120349666 [Nilaparvata lugens]|uniref:uncharacterized protein LOC120349666 n=1 Tax=Nilaparvata lugens TaxID=108931 RepID=UPI00193C9E08|nr:uncharacterized protein LOC120349666 [Nilaparvata lugens]
MTLVAIFSLSLDLQYMPKRPRHLSRSLVSVSCLGLLSLSRREPPPLQVKTNVKLSIGYINVQCLRTKLNLVDLFACSYAISILCISEHWLKSEEIPFYSSIGDLVLANSFCRTVHGHGGVAIYVNKELNFKELNLQAFCREFVIEITGIVLTHHSTIVLVVYHTGNELEEFLSRLDDCLAYIANFSMQIIVSGDFNSHFNYSLPAQYRLENLLRSLNLYFCNRLPTRGPNCIDNVATNLSSGAFEVSVANPQVADHLAIVVKLLVGTQVEKATDWHADYEFCYRKINLGVVHHFIQIFKSEIVPILHDDQVSTVKIYKFFCEIISVFDSIFPVKSRSSRMSSHAQTRRARRKNVGDWFSHELNMFKFAVSLLYQKYELTQDRMAKEVAFSRYLRARKLLNQEVDQAVKRKNADAILDSQNPCKSAWKLINKCRASTQPQCDFSPDVMNSHYLNSVEAILQQIPVTQPNGVGDVEAQPTVFSVWRRVSKNDVLKIVTAFKNSPSQDIYGFTVAFLKSVVDEMAPHLASAFSQCLKLGYFPNCLKLGKTVPIYKKRDEKDKNNFQPINVTPLLGEILEVAMKDQLMDHLERNSLLSDRQHGFGKSKSTQTALLALINEVIDAFESGDSVAVRLCDLSRDFDCVSHELLLGKLSQYGIKDIVSDTFKSYLSDRRQIVDFRGASSGELHVRHGVPRGSVLRPVLFILHMNDLRVGRSELLFADDTTLVGRGSSPAAATLELEESFAGAER